MQIVQTRRRARGIDFFSFCHHRPFDPAFADILPLPPSLWKKGRAPVDRPVSRARIYIYIPIYSLYMRVCAIERDGCATLDSEGIWGVECGERKKKIRSRRDASARLGSARLRSALARLEIFKALFGYPLSREGGRVSVFASPC